jgi:hypothetical protein
MDERERGEEGLMGSGRCCPRPWLFAAALWHVKRQKQPASLIGTGAQRDMPPTPERAVSAIAALNDRVFLEKSASLNA